MFDFKSLLLLEIDSLTDDHQFNTYVKAWNYYVKSCSLSNEEIHVTFHNYYNTVPFHEAVEIASYTTVGAIPLDTILTDKDEPSKKVETYDEYVERCKKHNVNPLNKIKWQRMIVDDRFSLEAGEINEVLSTMKKR